MKKQFKAHPWHGVHIGDEAPGVVRAFIEIVPTDTVKYEIDKESGYLKVDRPQKFSNVVPTLYGFIPQTYCGKGVGELCGEKTGRSGIVGDGDPLDICVLSDHAIAHGDILMQAIPVGGLRLIDKGQADDKLIAVMRDDDIFGKYTDIGQIPSGLIDRLKHYFLTYKNLPGGNAGVCEITHVYGRDEALAVIEKAREDYRLEILPSL